MSCSRIYQRALARLPEMSVILVSRMPRTTNGAIYVPVEPRRSVHRGACAPPWRSAREVIFLEPDSAERPHLPDTYPDTYAVRPHRVEPYIEAYRVYPQPRTEEVDGARRGHGLEAAGRRSRWRAWSW